MERAKDSLSQFDRFRPIVKNVCEKYDGYRFKAGVKIKNRNQTKALVRIKEKMLADVYNQVELEGQLAVGESETEKTIGEQVAKQKNIFTQKMSKIFDTIDKPIPFKVSDMLRGKCLFNSI